MLVYPCGTAVAAELKASLYSKNVFWVVSENIKRENVICSKVDNLDIPSSE